MLKAIVDVSVLKVILGMNQWQVLCRLFKAEMDLTKSPANADPKKNTEELYNDVIKGVDTSLDAWKPKLKYFMYKSFADLR